MATISSRLKYDLEYYGYYEEKDCWKTFTTINNIKTNNIQYREPDDEMIMKTLMSIYDWINDWIYVKGCLTNY